ncbi:MAG: class I SAM-dependent methyltransferase [Candidatus Nitrosopolaris wilkensis]|nr:MAG: class I SAM-dependent methyltransferase [Candidatus Nitrosopolaris wilkensis]
MLNSLADFNAKSYRESRLKENFGLQGTGWIGLGRHYNNWMYKIRKTVLLRKMKSVRIDFNTADVLDIGSGIGFYIDIWKKLGAKGIVGIDITSMAVENLKRKYCSEEFFEVDIGDANLTYIRDRRYDIISAFDVLFHIIDDKRYETAIKNIYSLLKPNGIFIFSDNFLHGDTIRYGPQVSRSLQFIEKILIQSEFEIVERCPVFVLMNTPVDTTRRMTKMFWAIITSLVHSDERRGLVIGGILYPLERLLVSLLRESPSTELMICKRSNFTESKTV